MKFNPDNKAELTWGECLAPAMEIDVKGDALIYLRDYIEYIMNRSTEKVTYEQAETTAKINLAYFAGYYDKEKRIKVEHMFDCEHPYFGKCMEMGEPTPHEAFLVGKTNKTLKQVRDGI